MLRLNRCAFFLSGLACLVLSACGLGKNVTQSPLPPPYGNEAIVLERIAFGSCSDQRLEQPVWRAMTAYKPDLTLLLGDNVYASDDEQRGMLTSIYEAWGRDPDFGPFRAAFPILASWDDHDYGVNDAGASYDGGQNSDDSEQAIADRKKKAKDAFLNFWGYAPDHPRANREGNYDAVLFGPEGKRVQVIILDTRYFRSDLKEKPEEVKRNKYDRYFKNDDEDATVLGEAQWTWFAEQLQTPADLRIVITSIQFLSDESGAEFWGNFPKQRAHMLKVLRESGAEGVIMLSGDRHCAEISKMEADDPDGIGYPLYDFTGSGLTHSWNRDLVNTPNRYRVGDGLGRNNFCSLTLDWEAGEIDMTIHHENGDIFAIHTVELASLKKQQ